LTTLINDPIIINSINVKNLPSNYTKENTVLKKNQTKKKKFLSAIHPTKC